MYEIKRDPTNARQWVVVTKHGQVVQYRNMSKKFCQMWLADNDAKEGDAK
jgi:hypothetical protein